MTLGPVESHPQPALDFGEYLDGLYGYAVVLSRNSAEAEDLVQKTCLRALRAAGRLRADSNVKSWLFTILRNIWLNQLRQRRTTPEMVELDADGSSTHDPPDMSKDPHAVYVDELEREQVRAAIEQLPVEFREIIILREYEELSYQEIAAVLDCPPGTVMSRLARARSKLRELLPSILVTPRSQEKDEGTNSEAAFDLFDSDDSRVVASALGEFPAARRSAGSDGRSPHHVVERSTYAASDCAVFI